MAKANILVIAPHMDDEVLGCGGTIAKHAETGGDVFVSFVSHRIYDHRFDKEKNETEKAHASKAKEALGYKDAVFFELADERLDACVQDIIIPLERYVSKIRPDIVYCPFRSDNNQDHRAVFDAARVVLRPVSAPFIKDVYMYEIPSSTDQSPPLAGSAFLPNYYVDITKHMDEKIEAFKCYKTEKRTYPHPRSEKGLRIMAQKRGLEIGFKYAEAFMTLRRRWK